MSVKITNRQYKENYTAEVVDWLLGNTGDWQTLTIDAEVGIDYQATQQSPVQIDYINNAFILNAGTWGSYGFDTGMTLKFRYKLSSGSDGNGGYNYVSTYEKEFTILNISGSYMEVDEPIEADDFQTLPIDFGTKKISDVLLYSESPLQGCRLRYGHIPNNEQSTNLNSVIDSTTTEMTYVGLNNLPEDTWGVMEAIGLQSGMSIRQARVKKLSNNSSSLFATMTAGEYSSQTLFTDQIKKARSIPMVAPFGTGGLQTVTSQSELPISAGGSYQDGANGNQAFLFDNNGEFSRDLNISISLKITDATGAQLGDAANLVLLKYSNGSSMDIVSRTVLQSWINPQELINQTLTFNGITTVDLNDSDSLVLAIEHDINEDREGSQGIAYIITDFSMQISNQNEKLNLSQKQNFQFELEYLISTFFEELANIEEVTAPEYLQGDGSISDNFYTEFYPEWNNPNVMINNDPEKTRRLGNTGWFNENFNQLPNDFQIQNVSYGDENGNLVDALNYFGTTRMTAIVSNVPNITPATKLGFGFMWVPKYEDDYKNKTTPYYRNTFINTGDGAYNAGTYYPNTSTGGGIGMAWMEVKNVQFQSLGGNQLYFEATFMPTAAFSALFDGKDEDDRKYIVWISVADQTLGRNFSNRVSLLADFNDMVKSVPPAGPYPYIQNAFIEHPYEADVIGVEQYNGFVQDDVLCRLPFQVDPSSTTLQKFRFGIEVFNPSTSERHILEKFDVDMTQFFTDANGVPFYNVNTTRGFKLQDGNNKNWVKINREASLDTAGKFGYLAFYAFKIRWEDWIQRSDMPAAFFDPLELNQGFNNDWFHYLSTIGWKMNFFVEIDAVVDTVLVQYRNRFDFKFADYDKNTRIQTRHQYFRNSDNTLLNVGTDPVSQRPLGVVLSNEPTRLEIEYEILDAGTWNPEAVYATATIEVDKGAGFMQMRQISSVWGSEPDNPLVPLEGESRLKIEVDGTNKILKTSCLIDPDLLEDAPRYRITGRVGCYEDGGVISFRLYADVYAQVYE